MTPRTHRITLLLTLAALMLGGCSAWSYESRWKKAADLADDKDPVTGRWSGTWLSDHNQHTGTLRAIITKKDDKTYDVDFLATYFADLITFTYKMDMVPTRKDGGVFFEGKVDLGRMAGGIYEYKGKVTPEKYFSNYKSQYDHGTYQMTPFK